MAHEVELVSVRNLQHIKSQQEAVYHNLQSSSSTTTRGIARVGMDDGLKLHQLHYYYLTNSSNESMTTVQ